MKALIIAAGKGNRIKSLTGGKPKPLTWLLGLSLIERIIYTSKSAGINEFIIVVGYKGDEIKKHLGNGSKYGVKISFIDNPEWSKGNGVSVLKARELLSNENFILLMSDHLFDKEILKKLLNISNCNNKVLLSVDSNLKNDLIDKKDVTKVLVCDGVIKQIGKEILEYNAYDTGIFLCSPIIFDALEESIKRGDYSLTGAIKILSEKKNAYIVDVKNKFWIDVDNEKMYKKAKKYLLKSLIKPEDGFISKKINRKISLYFFTPLFFKIYKNITPNQVSFISFFIAIASSLSFIFNNPVIGAILLQTASIIDGCDGEIARLKYLQSPFGDFLDALLDRYADGFIISSIGYYCINNITSLLNGIIVYFISTIALLGHLMVSYSSAKSVVNFKYKYRGRLIHSGRGRDLSLFILFISGCLGGVHPIFVLLGLLVLGIRTNIIVIIRALISWKISSLNLKLFRQIKGIIFDFDGTVADTMDYLTDTAVKLISNVMKQAEVYKLSTGEVRKKYIETTGLPFFEQLKILFPEKEEKEIEKIAKIFEKEKEKEIFKYNLVYGVKPTLKFLKKKGIKVFLCSSTREEIVKQYCYNKGVDKYIDEIMGLKEGLKKMEQIKYILRKYKFDHREVIFIGDSLRDKLIADEIGISFLALSGTFRYEEFVNRKIDVIHKITDLIKIIKFSEKVI